MIWLTRADRVFGVTSEGARLGTSRNLAPAVQCVSVGIPDLP